MAGVPGIDAGGNLAGGGGIFFQSGSGSAESGICTRVESARHDLSGGRSCDPDRWSSDPVTSVPGKRKKERSKTGEE